MSNVRPQLRRAIENILEKFKDEHTPEDILRVLQEEANLLKETQEVRDAITSDPYENLKAIPSKELTRFQNLQQVVVCDRQRCGADFARTHAIVALFGDDNRPSSKRGDMKLIFTYERKPRRGAPPNDKGSYPCQVSYCIELAYGHGQRQRLLEVTIWAASNVPSTLPAVCIQDEVDDGWEDIDDDEEVNAVESQELGQATKRQPTRGDDLAENSDEAEVDEEDRDQYVAFLDPDVLQSFCESAGFQSIDDGTAFFLLMTFPFFEHEWDIVGFVLEQMFGGESDNEEES